MWWIPNNVAVGPDWLRSLFNFEANLSPGIDYRRMPLANMQSDDSCQGHRHLQSNHASIFQAQLLLSQILHWCLFTVTVTSIFTSIIFTTNFTSSFTNDVTAIRYRFQCYLLSMSKFLTSSALSSFFLVE